ncbi:hypothetical protein QQM39_45540 [Streptomyces sp. DT2A-34]|uniref:hypothetical protein n=1 Tax=Streptomyces sp. DT2A-34 TaxID=3051182 RepID=UPI00265C3A2F|nr:hypothetical protein [Streptomyces sp. DT2A-34]MDO0917793.1 hypothetical protein [Streptomyces sp. DT2A-34]
MPSCTPATSPARGPHPVDLMDMLQQSVREAHVDRVETEDTPSTSQTRPPRHRPGGGPPRARV